RGRGEAVPGIAAVLVALGKDGVALEDEEPGVAIRVQELVQPEVGHAFGALERARRRGLLHPVGRIELVHAAPDVDQALGLEEDVLVRRCERQGREQNEWKNEKRHARIWWLTLSTVTGTAM